MLVMEMSNKKQEIPAIRFKGFTDTWEQRKLEEDISVAGGAPPSKSNPEYWNGSIVWLSSQEIKEKYVSKGTYTITKKAVDDNTTKMVKAGTPLIVSRSGILARLFPISIPTTDVAINQDIKALIFDPNIINTNFFVAQLQKNEDFILRSIVKTGTTVQSINMPDFYKLQLSFPSTDEQEKVGKFFQRLDDTIALHQRQLENYKELKKLMLQKIFNRELCFKDENGNDYPEWEEIALKELGETFTGLSGKTKENFGKGKGKFVTYMNVFSNPIANLAMTENVEIKDGEKQNEVCYGDIFFTTSSETPDEVGMSSVWLSHESNVYLNSFCFGYRLNSESESKVISQFLGAQLRAEHIRKEIVLLAQGSTRFNISKAKLIEIPLYLPVIQEQQKIADFLSMLDVRIEQLSQKVELLKEQKKGLMQKMFV